MQTGEVFVGRYRLVRQVGRGGMGQVWQAEDLLLNRHVAIKALATHADAEMDAEMVQRAMREARLAGQLNHPNAVQVHDLIVAEGRPYVVMEYVEGQTLDQRIRAEGAIPAHVMRPLVRQVAAGLAAAHHLGIVHRDVKPANVLIADDGTVKLADFGIARTGTDPNLTGTGAVIGTIAFMAPEVAGGAAATPASDVWSLGATLYCALEGTPPHGGENTLRMLYRRVNEPAPHPTRAGELAGLVDAMLAREPARRPLAREVARELDGSAPLPQQADATRPRAEAQAALEVDTMRRSTSMPPTTNRPPVTSPYPPPPPQYVTPAQGYSPYPQAPPRAGNGRVLALVAAVVGVLVAAGVVVAVVLTSKSNGGASASRSTAADGGPGTVVTVTRTSTAAPILPQSASSGGGTSAVGTTPQPTADLATYSGGYGKLTVQGPAGWTLDSDSKDQYSDYDEPGSPARLAGASFRIGVGNASPRGAFTAEARQAAAYLRSQYGATILRGPQFTEFLGSECADIEYTYRNDTYGVNRHGIERIWRSDGMTFIIQSSGLDADWGRSQEIFAELVTSAEVN